MVLLALSTALGVRFGPAAVKQAAAFYEACPTSAAALAVGAACLIGLVLAFIGTKQHEQKETAFIKRQLDALKVRASDPSRPLRALITGANSGIGFKLAEILAGAGVHVILGCRSKQRGQDAVDKIKAAVPGAKVNLLIIDVSEPASVLSASKTLMSDPQYGLVVPPGSGGKAAETGPRLDYLVLNAGIMPIDHYRWSVVLETLLYFGWLHFFETSHAYPAGHSFLAQPVDETVTGGAPSMLATHVLGHLMLVQELQPVLAPTPDGRVGRVIWTGSRSSSASAVNWEQLAPPAAPGQPGGLQKKIAEGTAEANDTYCGSKYLQDLINAALSRRVNHPCTVICPGYVSTDLTPLFFKAAVPFFMLVRAYTPGFNITPDRGTAAHIGAMLAPVHGPGSFSSTRKYVLACDRIGEARNGSPDMPLAAQEKAWTVVNKWLDVWRSVAGAEKKGVASPVPSSAPARAKTPSQTAGTTGTGAVTPSATKAPQPTAGVTGSARKSVALQLLEMDAEPAASTPAVSTPAASARKRRGSVSGTSAAKASSRKSPARR